MQQLFEYYGRFQGFRGSLLGLPGWARGVLFLAALPGILALALSIALVLCSLVALLLLTVPAYRLLKLVCGGGPKGAEPVATVASPGRRHVDVKIIE